MSQRAQDRREVRRKHRELRRDGGMDRDDRREVRALRKKLHARRLNKRADSLHTEPKMKPKAAPAAEPKNRPAVRPGGRAPMMRPFGPGGQGGLRSGNRLQRRPQEEEPEEEFEEELLDTDEDVVEEVESTLTGALAEISGVVGMAGETAPLSGIVAGLFRQGYSTGDIIGAVHDLGYEMLEEIRAEGVELGASVGEARAEMGAVVQAVRRVGKGIKNVAKRIRDRVRENRDARKGLRAKRKDEAAALVNNQDVSRASSLAAWSQPVELTGMRFQAGAGKAAYVQPIDSTGTMYVVTITDNKNGVAGRSAAVAGAAAIIGQTDMVSWRNSLLRTVVAAEVGCEGRRCCRECEQGL